MLHIQFAFVDLYKIRGDCMRTKVLVGLLVVAGLGTAAERPSLKLLYDQHRWFELRDATTGQEAPPLYRGAVASAFNDSKTAEKYLNETIKSQPNSDVAKDAHGILAKLYVRAGRYQQAVQQLDEMLRIKPGQFGRQEHACCIRRMEQTPGSVDSERQAGQDSRRRPQRWSEAAGPDSW
jgi:tetratricopeptide (TPR) repeat protein